MLRNCFLPVNYNKPREKCCGEIVYQSFDEFVFLCKLCKLKIFEFHDFVKHLKHVHEEELVGDSGNKNIDTDNTITNNDLDGSKEKDQHILKFEIDNNRYHPIRSELNGEIEETFEFDNDEISWQDNTDDNERDRSFTGSDSEKPDEEEVKSIIRKPRKLKEFTCETCNKKYSDERRLHMHVKIVHLREKPYKCDFCDQCFTDSRSLNNHIGHNHTGFDCPTCHKTFSSSRNLKRHMFLHVESKEFICPQENCGKAFASKGLLRDHQRCHRLDILICEECGYKCRQRESLIVHKRHHTGEKPFACHLCESRFGSKPLLKEHMATHETDRNHVCDVCGKSFNRPKALYHHKHLHLGIKKFVCKICGHSYSQAAGLSAHMRKHREESGFSSEVCSNPINVFYSNS